MRTLAIETAADACSVALIEGEAVVAYDHRVIGRGHAEALVPMIAALPDRGRSSRILVSLGPGSFTGVRIGLATARALGFAWNAEVLGFPTLALVAAQADAGAPLTVCMNGGHGEWFVQDFAQGASLGELHSLTPPAAAVRGAQRLIVGNRAREFAALLGGGTEAVELLPDAGAVPILGLAHFTTVLAPIYGRGPDATPMAERRPA